MADIADNGAFNSNLGNIQAAQWGPNATTQRGLTQAQTQQQLMSNQVQRASMPLIMQALNEATADQSASNPGAPSSPGAPGAAARADQSGTQDNWYNADSLEDKLRNQNYVPTYTAQEMKMLQASKSLSIADPARGKALFDNMNAQREARMAQQNSQNQLQMGNVYDAASSVATKGQGAFNALMAVDPQDAAAIKKDSTDAEGNFDADAADAKATQYAKHLAAVSHLYSGRPTDMQNGQLVDTKTGQAVTGRDQLFTGLDEKGRQAEWDKAVETIKWTTPDNVEHQDERWKAPTAYGGYGGKMTPAQAVLAADQAARHAPNGTEHDPGIIPHAAAAASGVAANAPATHGATAAQRVNAKVNRPTPTTGADIAAGNAPATGTDTGTLPGVNPNALPKVQQPSAAQGAGSGGTYGTKMTEGLAAKARKEIDDAGTASADAQTMRSQITQAKAEIPKIDPRTVGPGSGLYNTALKFYTAAAGSAPNALIDEGVLDKFLNQIGASNVRNLLAGQRITNQEMMTFLTRGSPSTAMPLGGIKHLLDYLDADNEYTLRYNRTKTMALKSGADPDTVDQELSNRSARADFVSRRTGSQDSLGGAAPPAAAGGKGPPTITNQKDYDALNPGDAYVDANGNPHHKGGR
jgi:hypothetical protein